MLGRGSHFKAEVAVNSFVSNLLSAVGTIQAGRRPDNARHRILELLTILLVKLFMEMSLEMTRHKRHRTDTGDDLNIIMAKRFCNDLCSNYTVLSEILFEDDPEDDYFTGKNVDPVQEELFLSIMKSLAEEIQCNVSYPWEDEIADDCNSSVGYDQPPHKTISDSSRFVSDPSSYSSVCSSSSVADDRCRCEDIEYLIGETDDKLDITPSSHDYSQLITFLEGNGDMIENLSSESEVAQFFQSYSGTLC
eukprot:Gb_24520 [translate_table: standard]